MGVSSSTESDIGRKSIISKMHWSPELFLNQYELQNPRFQNTTFLIKQYLKDIGPLQTLTAKQERELLSQYKSGSHSALERLVICSQYIVIEEVLYFVGRGLQLEDLIQNANVSLVRALLKYEVSSGLLKNYLHRNIYRHLGNSVRDQVSIVRYPANAFNAIVTYFDEEMYAEYLCLTQPLALHHDVDHIIYRRNDTGFDCSKIPYLRLDYSVLDFLTENKDVGRELLIESIKVEIRDCLVSLKEQERDVIKMYFGIDRDYALTLSEIGEEYNLTRERIRQIKKQAMNRLKHSTRKRVLRQLASCYDKFFSENHQITSRIGQKYHLMDPFQTIVADESEAIQLLEEYIQPLRRKTPYPEIKNMAEVCRRLIVSTLKSLGRPSFFDELRDYVYEKYPLLKAGTLEYALSSVRGVVNIGKGMYALREWGYLERVSRVGVKEIKTDKLRKAILVCLKEQETPISINYILSKLSGYFGRTQFSQKDERRIRRLFKKLDNVYRTLDNKYYFMEGGNNNE